MKIVIINGSARKGNTLTAINAFIKGADEKNEIEVIAPDKLHISPCKGCGACQCHKGCVDQDDTNPTIDKLVDYCFNTPEDGLRSAASVETIVKLIDKNKEVLKKSMLPASEISNQ